jgi:hypothetical protein
MAELAQRASGLIVPPEYADRAPAFRCTVCGMEFPSEQRGAWQRHVGGCARANMDKIKAATKVPPFMEDYDPEITQHMRGVGKRMIEEGRLEIKPNERAGFS